MLPGVRYWLYQGASVLSVSGTSFDPRTLFTIPRSLQDVLDYTECGVFVNLNLYVLRISQP